MLLHPKKYQPFRLVIIVGDVYKSRNEEGQSGRDIARNQSFGQEVMPRVNMRHGCKKEMVKKKREIFHHSIIYTFTFNVLICSLKNISDVKRRKVIIFI